MARAAAVRVAVARAAAVRVAVARGAAAAAVARLPPSVRIPSCPSNNSGRSL